MSCYHKNMAAPRTHSVVLEEEEKLRSLRTTNPSAIQHSGVFSTSEIEQHIGLTALPTDVPIGYLRYRPEDFIVEEIDQQGQVVTIDPEPVDLLNQTNHQALYCHMVKVGLDSLEALERTAHALNLPDEAFSYAGLKDARAITAQRIAIKGGAIDQASQTPIDSVFLKHFWTGKGKLYRGDLTGNRFTITLRSAKLPGADVLQSRIETLRHGFSNYYGTQRFGRRLLSHHFGKLVCQGKFQEAVETFLTANNAVVRNYEADVRNDVAVALGDWQTVKTLLSQFPYTFAFELTIVDHLLEHPNDWTGALTSISEQVKLWVYAYMSWLLNITLSSYATSNIRSPEILPIPLSTNDHDREPFRELLAQDDVPFSFIEQLRPLSFLDPKPRTLNTWVVPTIHTWKTTPVGLVISFDLPTGAYATTALRQLFILEVDEPAPAWVPTAPIDPKAVLGTGSIEPLRKIFGAHLEPRTTYSPLAME